MDAIDALLDAQARDGRVWPSYGDWGVANVPDTVAALLDVPAERPLSTPAIDRVATGRETAIEHVVLFVIDGLGWNRSTDLRESIPSLDRLAGSAPATPLTSTYPSETAATMITLYTGLQPVEHGLLGWFARFDEPTMIAHALPFRSLEGEPLDEAHGHDPATLFDVGQRTPLPRRLTDAGVRVGYVNPTAICDSHASRLAAGPADRLGYATLEDAFAAVIDRIEAGGDRTYHLVYYGDADEQGHRHDTASPAFRAAVAHAVDGLFAHLLDGLGRRAAERTAVLVVADHGQVDTDPATNVDIGALDADGRVALSAHLERGVDGEPLNLAGGPRNLQCYVRDGHREALRDELEAELPVITLDEAAYRDRRLFGDRRPSPRFEQRAPDLVAIPDDGSIWYGDGEIAYPGMHGGVHPDEMLVPLWCARASELR